MVAFTELSDASTPEESFYSHRRRFATLAGDQWIGLYCWPVTGEVELHALSSCCQASLTSDWDDDVACQSCDAKLPGMDADAMSPELILSTQRGAARRGWTDSHPVLLDETFVKSILRRYIEAGDLEPLGGEIVTDEISESLVELLSSLELLRSSHADA